MGGFWDLASLIFATILGKIITDSLPNISIKDILKYTASAIANARLFVAFVILYQLFKRKKLPPHYEHLFIFLIVAALISEFSKKLSKQRQIAS